MEPFENRNGPIKCVWYLNGLYFEWSVPNKGDHWNTGIPMDTVVPSFICLAHAILDHLKTRLIFVHLFH
jgi:hypothetical protein